MFSNDVRYSTTKTGRYVKELPLSFPKLETESKKLFVVRFLLLFLFRPMVKKLPILFRQNCNISFFETVLKIVS